MASNVAGILLLCRNVKRYLEPPFQCRVRRVDHEGVEYPVVIVPPHGARPVIAKADGPQTNGRVTGVRQGVIYVRDVGPASAPIARPEAWTALLERCLSQRADLLASIMRQAINRPSAVSPRVGDLLKEACQATEQEFVAQTGALVGEVSDPLDRTTIGAMANNHVTFGYALVGADGELLQINDPWGLARRVNIAMRQRAYRADEWSMFLPLKHEKSGAEDADGEARRRGAHLPGGDATGDHVGGALSDGLLAHLRSGHRLYC